MRKSKFTEAQIVGIVREYDSGVAAKELARRHGISENTVRSWKTKYRDMDVSGRRPAQAARSREFANAPDHREAHTQGRRHG